MCTGPYSHLTRDRYLAPRLDRRGARDNVAHARYRSPPALRRPGPAGFSLSGGRPRACRFPGAGRASLVPPKRRRRSTSSGLKSKPVAASSDQLSRTGPTGSNWLNRRDVAADRASLRMLFRQVIVLLAAYAPWVGEGRSGDGTAGRCGHRACLGWSLSSHDSGRGRCWTDSWGLLDQRCQGQDAASE